MTIDAAAVVIHVPQEVFEEARAQFEGAGASLDEAISQDPRAAYDQLGFWLRFEALNLVSKESRLEQLDAAADEVLDGMVPELDASPREVLVEIATKPSFLNSIRARKRQRVVTALRFSVPAL